MKFLIVSALLSAALLVASSPVDSDVERANAAKWESFKAAHGKEYAPGEELIRKTKFLAVDALIQANNQDPNSTFTMAHNKLSDLTDPEKQALLGALPPPIDDRTIFEEVELDRQAPKSLDLRKNKCVGPVKNQGGCGSCWAFSATGPLEWSYCKKYGSYVSLSEQQVVSCATSAGGGCQGGWPDAVYDYYMKVGGSVPTSVYPYTSGSNGKNGVCTFNSAQVKAKVASHGYISPNPTSIINALNTYGALSVCVQVNNAFFNYKSGVFSDPTCKCDSTSCPINHAIVNVGYGTDPKGGDYWITRNSWSSGWGNQGYMLIKRGVGMCGIEKYVYRVSAA